MGGKGRKHQQIKDELRRRCINMYKKIIIAFTSLFLSACLLTHQDIDEEAEKNNSASAGSSQIKNSLQVKMSEMSDSLRQLRGDIELLKNKQSAQELWNQDKQKEITELKNDVQGFIKDVDSRVIQLAENLQEQKEKASKFQENNPDYIFYQAEELFKKQEWKKAILYYEKYRKKNKKGRFYKKATLNIGLCFQNLDLKKEAKVFFKEVVAGFPKSQSAKKAKKMLSAFSKNKKASVKKQSVNKPSKASVKKQSVNKPSKASVKKASVKKQSVNKPSKASVKK